MEPKRLKNLLATLGFTPQEDAKDRVQKHYPQHQNYAVTVDCNTQTIDYGAKIQYGSKRTLNFDHDENFVVLECVDRLLAKGYKPENIELEKVWRAGHGHSGELDICVYTDTPQHKEYLLIECKTSGTEFNKELANLRNNGGQLFTYFKFSNTADVLMLYSSALSDNKIVYRNEIVKIEEPYRQGDVTDFYDNWDKLTKDNGIFEAERVPYQYKSKALKHSDLKDIELQDSKFIFIQFLEILRHNVVSDKPNAFNKIFTLFLCKIYDEKEHEGTDKDLDFQWRDDDNHVTFQLRLTELYKNGMKDFLEKNVSDFDSNKFEKYCRKLDETDKAELRKQINELRLEKNNEFAIKEVFDKRSFEENAIVVKAVVQLLEKFKVRYSRRQQFLSDFFELLLTTGLKQEAGQFFTPVPIAQFIIKSLPIDELVQKKFREGKKDDLLPYIMDFAAGSGHFLTESMHLIQELLSRLNPAELKSDPRKKLAAWRNDPFDWAMTYIYGIEKDYRLVKVGKVGCYLHGDGLANVIHSDGLAAFGHEDYKEKLALTDKNEPRENKQFDVVVSNPPYSVSTFKNAAKNYYGKDDFELYEYLTENSSEIECLFIERTKQLLNDGGMAGIILPSSILSNAGIYGKAREMIFKYFEIIAITELGSGTFMATGTNTVVLFLRRRSNYETDRIYASVERFFTNFVDVTINGIETPVSQYLNYVWSGLQWDDYLSLLKKVPNEAIREHELYKEYETKIKARDAAEWLEKILAVEMEKLYYFVLAFPQKTVIVKSGNKEAEKRFLGYEFSFRRGSEGIHPVQRGKMIDECTMLFDADIEVFDNPEKASTYICGAFKDSQAEWNVPDCLKEHVFKMDLIDLMTFDWAAFDKRVSLTVKKKVKVKSRWDVVKIGQIATTQYGFTEKATERGEVRYLRITDLNDDGSINLENDQKFINPSPETRSQFLLKHNDIVIARSGSVGKSAIYKSDRYEDMIFASYLIRLQADEKQILPDYLFYFTQTELYWDQVMEMRIALTQPNLNAEKIKEFKIPLPPLDVQVEIVKEIERFERKEKTLKDKIAGLQSQIASIVDSVFTGKFEPRSLSDITEIRNGGTPKSSVNAYWDNGTICWATLVDTKKKYLTDTARKITQAGLDSSNAQLLPVNTVLFSSRATIGDVTIAKVETATNQGYKNFICDQSVLEYEFLYYILRHEAKNIEQLASGMTYPEISKYEMGNFKIPLPPLSEQKKIVAKIEKLEHEIANLQTEFQALTEQKNAVLRNRL